MGHAHFMPVSAYCPATDSV